METNEHFYEENDDLTISDASMKFLEETGKWGYFMAIVGFVFIALLVVLSFFIGSLMGSIYEDMGVPVPGMLMGVIYIIMAAIYFFPVLYLYKFSTKIKVALREIDNMLLEEALENLKSLYKFMGIFTIVSIGLYVLMGLGVVFIGKIL